MLGGGTIGLADIAGAVQGAAGVAAKAGTRKQENEKKRYAAAPQLSRTRTGAPRA
ncbi:MAG TPA: hypothetical protein VNO25_08480 [Streptosporangiaceae bacterium]|nr:hypothetical protein [Streptosporangiaceae bacterium]